MNSFSAIHAEVKNEEKENARYTKRIADQTEGITWMIRDFIERIIDEIFSGIQAIGSSVEIIEKDFEIEPAMKQYLIDKYPVITFK